tara:strand:- start:65 stop:274 length:210 start_codon:yes stop_codon:yes gene_type:complete
MAGKQLEPIKVEIGLDMKAFIFGVRASDALGKQAYNKVLTLAEKDIEKLKEVQRFINVLVELHEEREVD